MSKDSNINFNSIKVRLEQTTLQDDEHNLNDFNSIKVRLERIFSSSLFLIHLSFQFHKGAIRTDRQRGRVRKVEDFNSIKVRLEPGFILNRVKTHNIFQFHKGAIRTLLRLFQVMES